MAKNGLSFYDRKSADEYRTQLKSEGWDSTLNLDPNTGMWMVTKYGLKKTPRTDITFIDEPFMSTVIDDDIPTKEQYPEEYAMWENLYRKRLTKKKFENWLETEQVEKEVELEEAMEHQEDEKAKAKKQEREELRKEAKKREEELKGMVEWSGSVASNIGEGKSPGKGLVKQAGIPHGARIRMGAKDGGPRIGTEGAIGMGKPAIGNIKTNISPKEIVVATPLPEETPLKESPNPKKLGFDKLGKGFAELPKGLGRKERESEEK